MPPFVYRILLTNDEKVYIDTIDSKNGHFRSECLFRYEKNHLDDLMQRHHQLKDGDCLDAGGIRQMGVDLFNILLDAGHRGKFLNYYLEAREAMGEAGICLKVEIDIDRSLASLADLAALPWEFLKIDDSFVHQATGLFINNSPGVCFCRRQISYRTPNKVPLISGQPLRVALAVASPEKDEQGNELAAVGYKSIYKKLQALEEAYPSKFHLLPIETNLTLESLDNILALKPHIFHFIGHGDFSDPENMSAQARLKLCKYRPGRGNIASPLSAQEFGAKFIAHAPGIVILQACEGGMQSSYDALSGVAVQVSQRSIPATISMQYEVQNLWAETFIKAFYQALLDTPSLDVDQAVQTGRKAMVDKAQKDSGDITHHFALPVLHRTNPEKPVFETSTDAVDQSSPDEQVYLRLLDLDYRWQSHAFQKFLRHPEKLNTGAFLIHGPQYAGQEWLVHKLITLLPGYTSSNRPIIEGKLNSASGTPERLWKSLRFRAGLTTKKKTQGQFTQEEAKTLAELWQNGYSILRLFNANQKWFETEFDEFYREFWQPLLQLVTEHPPQGDFRLIVFLIDTEAEASSWESDVITDGLDDAWQPNKIVRLSCLDEKIKASAP